jgi:3-hydroxyisobutyrate dehydrogenase
MLGNRGPRIVDALAGATPPVLSRVDIFVKDLSIVHDAAERAGLRLPVAEAAERLFARADAAGLATEDDAMVSRVVDGSRPPAARP